MFCIAKCFAQGYGKFKKLGTCWEDLQTLKISRSSLRMMILLESPQTKSACRVVLIIEGYFATVLLVDETIDQLEQELDSMHHFANSLGLLDEAKPQHWASTSEAIATPHWCRMVIWLLQCVAQLLSATFGFAFISSTSHNNGIVRLFSFFWAVPFFVLSIVFAYDSKSCLFIPCPCLCLCSPRMRRRRLKPTQILYRKHFGVQGSLYHLKVAILQLLTVLLQAKGKFSMLSVLVDGVETDLWALHSFKCFIGLLSFNIIFPALILAFPHSAVSRVGAACMDAALDLSYVVVWLFLLAQNPRSNRFPFWSQSTPVAGQVGIPWYLELHVRLLQCCTRLLCLPIFGTNQLASAFAISAAQAICRAAFHADDVRCGICTGPFPDSLGAS